MDGSIYLSIYPSIYLSIYLSGLVAAGAHNSVLKQSKSLIACVLTQQITIIVFIRKSLTSNLCFTFCQSYYHDFFDTYARF